jgi:putative NIF3 family GTP cyclohydrolase 1 type 2
MVTTIQDVIDIILEAVPGAPFEDSVDTFKSGDPTQRVTGIVTTFLASFEVIRRAIELGANLIIAHEPTFYNHRDEVDWLAADPVYTAKRQLLEDNNVTVWRFHDYWRLHQPDGILTGFVKELSWQSA